MVLPHPNMPNEKKVKFLRRMEDKKAHVISDTGSRELDKDWKENDRKTNQNLRCKGYSCLVAFEMRNDIPKCPASSTDDLWLNELKSLC